MNSDSWSESQITTDKNRRLPRIKIKSWWGGLFVFVFLLLAFQFIVYPSLSRADFYWGNQYVFERPYGSNLEFDALNDRMAYRLKAKKSGKIELIRFVFGADAGEPNSLDLIAGMMRDSGGNPTGVWLSSGSWVSMDNNRTFWDSFSLNPKVDVSSGEIVYFVFQAIEIPSGGTQHELVGAYPQQWKIPYDGTNDSYMNIGRAPAATPNNYTWIAEDPIIIYKYENDDTWYGQPYCRAMTAGLNINSNPTALTDARVYGTIFAGSRFTVSGGDKEINKIAVQLWRTATIPGDNLYMRLFNESDSEVVIDTTSFVTPAGAPTGNQWISLDISTTTLISDKTYRLYFFAPLTGSTSYYNLLFMSSILVDRSNSPTGDGYPWDTASYDGTNTIFLRSIDSGVSWLPQTYADIAFRLNVTNCLTCLCT